MSSFAVGLKDIDKTNLLVAGGKGANLGELSRIKGVLVPEGFCISTEAFKRITGETPAYNILLDELSFLKVDDHDKIIRISSELSRIIEGLVIPEDIKEEITRFISTLGEKNGFAVRSSATAEDLPATSFAGQHDSYLNVTGRDEILKHISKCWASVFSERAIIYRIQNGFDHHKVHIAVIVQKMVFPQTSGVLFTADPVTSNRKILYIEASFGLGEALVSGIVNADIYKVYNGKIIDKKISAKMLSINALQEGGTKEQDIEPERQIAPALSDGQILELEQLGRRIEEHFDCPQDIEWCLSDDKFYFVQSRPITTLYPIPDRTNEANNKENRVYISVGHQQMMTDAMKPLGLSLFQLTAARPMYKAGGRLFVDVTQILASPDKREIFLDTIGRHDPLIKEALITISERGDFIRSSPEGNKVSQSKGNEHIPDFQTQIEFDPAIVPDLIRHSQILIDALNFNIQTKSGIDLIDFIFDDVRQLNNLITDPQSFAVIMTGINASSWINEKMMKWLGEKNVADTLTQSVPDNITSEMGLALLDVADVIRPFPEVIAYLYQVNDDNFLNELEKLQGGHETRDAIFAFLAKYGMRCIGEVDITRPRWSEKPSALVPIILSNIRNFVPGSGNRKFEQGKLEAFKKEQELLDRLRRLPGGKLKVKETKRMISLMRNFIGYREYPKYSIISRYFIYKQALLEEAGKLVQAKVIDEKEDIYYLTFEELRELIKTNKPDYQLIRKRKDEYRSFEKLIPPRVITSDGEIITGEYKHKNLPVEAIPGLPVSSGVSEGRARVILNIENADLEDGDILVTTWTDPSWTPLFISIKGLVTEVGGLMTHGVVIAREYGLPAVVGVVDATRLIRDGQMIRVNGTEGYVEIL